MQRLNISHISRALSAHNFSFSDVAKRLSVSADDVSSWMTGKSAPVAHRLVRLSMMLDLSVDELFIEESNRPPEPVVAYRKMAGKTTTDVEVEQAREKGRLLRGLVPYLRNRHIQPAALRSPTVDYHYLQQVVSDLRKDLKVEPSAPIGPNNLIEKFRELGAVLVPVMWGKREAHGNALHILLPDSKATWIFINLDTNACDFNFWMAHELAHVFTPDLAETDAGEDFADAFAQTLLFPEVCAAKLYHKISGKGTGVVINGIKRAAIDHTISPYTVFKSLNAYAKAHGYEDFEKVNVYGAVKNVEKKFMDVSTFIFGPERPNAKEYVTKATDVFDTDFFELVQSYLLDTPHSAGWLAEVLEVSYLDAKGLYEVLATQSQ